MNADLVLDQSLTSVTYVKVFRKLYIPPFSLHRVSGNL